jgi:hypothetical protein
MFNCNLCNKEFTTNKYLKQHFKSKSHKLADSINKKDEIIEKPSYDKNDKVLKYDYKLEPFKLDIDHRNGKAQCIALIMASGAGKTTLINYILNKYFKSKEYITFMYASNLNSDIYKKFDRKIIKTYDFLPECITAQKKINQIYKNAFKFCNVLDDQVSNDTKNDEMLKRLSTSYRNSNINTIVTAQYNKMLSRPLRGNCKIMIFGHLNTDEDILDVIKLYVGFLFNGMNLSNHQKISMYRDITSDYKMIVYNTHTNKYIITKIKL